MQPSTTSLTVHSMPPRFHLIWSLRACTESLENAQMEPQLCHGKGVKYWYGTQRARTLLLLHTGISLFESQGQRPQLPSTSLHPFSGGVFGCSWSRGSCRSRTSPDLCKRRSTVASVFTASGCCYPAWKCVAVLRAIGGTGN